MPYQVSWEIPNRVLRLELRGDIALADFAEIDQHISSQLQKDDRPVLLVVDACHANITAHGIDHIRTSQSYLQSHQIKRLLVVTGNKVTRLAIMLLFNLCRPSLQFFNTPAEMETVLDMVIRVF